jgi:tetratricopeptide (TPR) repeat protein
VSKTIGHDPKSAKAFGERGVALLITGNWRIAVSDFDRAIELAPKHAAYYVGCARANFATNDFDKAIADLNAAIRLDPKNFAAYVKRSEAYAAKRKYSKAIADASQALELNPKHEMGYCSPALPLAFLELKKIDEAVAECTNYIKMSSRSPELAEIYGIRARARQLQGKLDEAIADLTLAVMMDTKSADLRHQRAVVYEAKGDKIKAQQDFDQAKKLGFR